VREEPPFRSEVDIPIFPILNLDCGYSDSVLCWVRRAHLWDVIEVGRCGRCLRIFRLRVWDYEERDGLGRSE